LAELLAKVAENSVSSSLETQALSYAIAHLVPHHMAEVRQVKEPLIIKTIAAVKERLTKEIMYWDIRSVELQAQEAAGRINARLNSGKARQRTDELEARLHKRLAELAQERQFSPLTPVVLGGALIMPAGLFAKSSKSSEVLKTSELSLQEKQRVEQAAMQAVMSAERQLGYQPVDVGHENRGYDIESTAPDKPLRFIEVKGKLSDKPTVTITRNEILTALNKPAAWILALVQVPPEPDAPCDIRYLRHPFSHEPDFATVSVTFDFKKLWELGGLTI